ncbi:hypothetical protein JX265_008997 [Neoarthrinium moseri]|uniref:Uncharacterized protein n=1 Tax=Neoarthrinium moseri TaxID=1658444 RepID=A0A9P9WH65_9PEZI|nr:hypothetical protein JX265_008997 [Neoarthrinium moseri]
MSHMYEGSAPGDVGGIYEVAQVLGSSALVESSTAQTRAPIGIQLWPQSHKWLIRRSSRQGTLPAGCATSRAMAQSIPNVFSLEDSRYIVIKDDLEAYLKEVYAGTIDESYDFYNRNDRWCFDGPEELSQASSKGSQQDDGFELTNVGAHRNN